MKKTIASELHCFKSGCALLRQVFDVPADATEASIAPLPTQSPIHGSLKFDGSTCQIVGVSTIKCETNTAHRARSISDILRANAGKGIVELHYAAADGAIVALEGQIVSADGTVLVFETHLRALLAIPVAKVDHVKGALAAVVSESTPPAAGIVVKLNPQPKPTFLELNVLSTDVTWTASYHINYDESRMIVVFSGDACIMNDAIAIDGAFDHVKLMAGNSNIEMAHIVDPMANRDNVAEFLAKVASKNSVGSPAGMFGAGAFGGTSLYGMSQMPAAAGGGGTQQPVEAPASVNDLYVYTFSNVLIPKNERAMVPLVAPIAMPFTDHYDAEVDVTHSTGSDGASHHVPVWHFIKFKNLSSVPWTTGPILVTETEAAANGHLANKQLICQSLVPFTPVGADLDLKLTQTLGIQISKSEAWSSTTQTQLIDRNTYKKHCCRLYFTIKNQKALPVHLRLKVHFAGDCVKASALISKNFEKGGRNGVNLLRIVEFDLMLPSGQIQIVTLDLELWLYA